MRNLIESYTPDTIFWDANPQFTAIEPFKSVWKKDKSRGKKTSSDKMWAIAFCHHPKSDAYYISDKEDRIPRSVLGFKKQDDVDRFWDEVSELTSVFKDAALTQAEKSLFAWNDRLKKRDAFLSEQDYSFGYVIDGVEYKDNTKSLDDMGGKTAKFYEEYFKIKRELEEESAMAKNVKIKSSTASGEI